MVRLRPGSDLQQFQKIEILRNRAPIPSRSGPGWGVLQEKPGGVPRPHAQMFVPCPNPPNAPCHRLLPTPGLFLGLLVADRRPPATSYTARKPQRDLVSEGIWVVATTNPGAGQRHPSGGEEWGLGTEAPAEEPARLRQPEGGGRRGCGRASIPAESAAPPAHRAFLTPAPSSACAWHIQPSLSL